ncbi:MAG TPA: hypothetical protein VJ302_12020 [Blastocatellia bacterium]|nr:hypothetical protein [Blastocatellia bacterium]
MSLIHPTLLSPVQQWAIDLILLGVSLGLNAFALIVRPGSIAGRGSDAPAPACGISGTGMDRAGLEENES